MGEKPMKVAYQGEPGAYTEQSLLNFFQDVEPIPCETFDHVFHLVESGEVDRGMIPIENSLAGSIHQNYDNLLRHNLFINGEYYLRVRHCLIARPGISKDSIKKVISHPQALGQCAGYLRNMGVQVSPEYDTAGSVKLLQTLDDPYTAAIASRRAAEIYGMNVLEEGIEDDQENYTRFLVISKNKVKTLKDAKTTIVFTLKHQPGSLFKALSVLALRDIDLCKIESRPLKGTPWNYLFYIDLLGSEEDAVVQKALTNLEEYALMLRVFGSYPDARLKQETVKN